MENAVDGKSVPKFTSFRPKAAQPPSESRITSKADKCHDARGPRSQSREPRLHGHRRSEAKGKRQKGLAVHPQSVQESEPANQILDEGDFVIDRRGDEENLRYGSLHRWKVPTYRRSGYGNVLGLSIREKIDITSSKEKYLVIISDDTQKPRDKAIFAKIGSLKELRIQEQTFTFDDRDADFISLGRKKRTKRKRSFDNELEETESSDTSSDTHYRSINGNVKTIKPIDPDLEYSTVAKIGLAADKQNLEDQDRRRVISQKVVQDPSNGQAWLDLIELEDRKEKEQLSGNKYATADIKLSMYAKGLKQVKDEHFRESLIEGMMKEASLIWDPGQLSKKWHDTLRENPSSIKLHIGHLNFLQSTFSLFRFDDLREPFARCIDSLHGKTTVGLQRKGVYQEQGYALLRITLCMKDSGYTEQAIAIWQALLEFNFSRPTFEDTTDHSIKNVSFLSKISCEAFWDSEVARIGEENAMGWNNFIPGEDKVPDPKVDAVKPESDSESLPGMWFDIEQKHANATMLPARTMDDVGEDDPFRVVLYSDVEAFLVAFSPESHIYLLNAFLAFCRLPPLSNGETSWWIDSFVRNDGLQDTFATKSSSLQAQNLVGDLSSPGSRDMDNLKKSNPFNMTVHHYLICSDVLFARPLQWFSAFDSWSCGIRLNESIEVTWIRRTLRYLAERGIGGDDLAEYFLAFELNYFPEAAKKTAKTLLKKNPSKLRLYNAYACIESHHGNSAGAESVWMTATSMSGTNPDVVLLWNTWVWEELDSRGPAKALARLLSLVNQDNQQEPNGEGDGSPDLAATLSAQRVSHFNSSYHRYPDI